MNITDKKLERLTLAAQLYYEQNKNQHEIAQTLGVSRPMISRMLNEARELGIVHIEVRSHLDRNGLALARLRAAFSLQDGVLVPDGKNDNLTNSAVALAAIEFLLGRQVRRLGLGWGSIIGTVVARLEAQQPRQCTVEQVFPLLGNLGGANRHYQTNELVRVFAQQTLSQPSYLHAPAFFTTRQELDGFRAFESFAVIRRLWEEMDAALINVGNHPSTPDFATRARFGDLLDARKATGRLLSYYYNAEGEIIHSDTDYMLQVSLDTLRACRCVTAICSSNVMPQTLLGALRTGLVDYLIAPERLVRETLHLVDTH